MILISIILFLYFLMGVMMAAAIIEARNIIRVLNEHSLHTDVTLDGIRRRLNNWISACTTTDATAIANTALITQHEERLKWISFALATEGIAIVDPEPGEDSDESDR